MASDYTRRELDQSESEDLNIRFMYHAPKEGQIDTYAWLRSMARDLGAAIMSTQGSSRERSLAITKIGGSNNVG